MPRTQFIAATVSVLSLGLAGCLAPSEPDARQASISVPAGRFSDVTDTVSDLMIRWHYNPAELDTADYRAMEAHVATATAGSETPEDFARRFNAVWREHGPFSHVRIDVARSSAADTAAYLDTMQVGGGGAKLDWRDDVAILTVNTMMGADTIEQIEAAYDEIAARSARALVVDLRANDGGAFAGMPLVGHVIDKPLDAGAFVSQRWARENNRAPVAADLQGVAPWTGASLSAFWRDAQEDRLLRIRFQPMTPHFAGPVFVLVSAKTASAAEMTADALRASGRATIIGEKTPGKMLSQKMYDLPQGLQLSLPIADYYSMTMGRIEGAGISPDVTVPSEDALETAMRLIAG